MKNLFITIKKGNLIAILLCFLLIFSHVMLYTQVYSYREVIDSFNKKIFNSFSKDETDIDDNNIFFVVNFLDKFMGKENPTLKLPSKEDYSYENGIFTFLVTQNLVIKSAGDGIVKNVGFLENGLKYVEIKHSGNIVTRYENLKIVGVGTNFLVKNIHAIGTTEGNFIFKILKNNEVVTNYLVEDGEILWQE